MVLLQKWWWVSISRSDPVLWEKLHISLMLGPVDPSDPRHAQHYIRQVLVLIMAMPVAREPVHKPFLHQGQSFMIWRIL